MKKNKKKYKNPNEKTIPFPITNPFPNNNPFINPPNKKKHNKIVSIFRLNRILHNR